MIEQTYNFLPILGEEKKVLDSTQTPGSVYFTTDTGKIYLDLDSSDKNKLPIGGQVNLYYGQKDLSNPPPADGKTEFIFDFPNDIVKTGKSNSKPGINDLILNSDGCFYKVMNVTSNTLRVEKLTIAGTGGGNNSSSTTDPNDKTSFYMSEMVVSPEAIVQGHDCFIKFAIEAHNEIGQYIQKPGRYELYVGESLVETNTLKGISAGSGSDFSTINPDEFMVLNVGPYLKSYNGTVTITVKAISSINGSKPVRDCDVSVTNMTLKWNPVDLETTIYKESLDLSWIVSGSNIIKTTYLQINDNEPLEIGSGTGTAYNYTLNFDEQRMHHGVYKLKMWVEGLIGGQTIPTDPIYKNLFVVEDNNTTPLISVSLFNTTFTQYDTVVIPIRIFVPTDVENNKGSEVRLWEGKTLKDLWNPVFNLTTYEWIYTPLEAFDYTSLRVACGSAEVSIPITIESLGIVIKETPNYAFKFKASDFASNSAVQNWSGDDYSVTFSANFDWINGGLKFKENSSQKENLPHILIKAGTSMQINYPMWTQNAPGSGKHLKVIFKASNCKNYDAQILHCKKDKKVINVDTSYDYLFILNDLKDENDCIPYYKTCNHDGQTLILSESDKVTTSKLDVTQESSRIEFTNKYVMINEKIYRCDFKKNPNDETSYYAVWHLVTLQDSFNGLNMTASNALLKSNTISMDAQYSDEEYIEFEMEILKRNNRPYAKFWIDGVPCNYAEYGFNDSSFKIDDIRQITVGSLDCDVLIYQIKLYEKDLTTDEHMNNFYADAPTGPEMVARFNRNNIIPEGELEIDPLRVAAENPECLVHIYEIPKGSRMPINKKDKQSCSYKQYQGKDGLKYEAAEATIKVQGTSSEAYVLAAANLDTAFDKIRNVATGTFDEGWSMTEDAYPINYACTKVNVASCENANNALNQEWYNMFQPYKSVLKCRNELAKQNGETAYTARDTMQFTNGVIFVKDENEKFDINAKVPTENNVFGDVDGYMGGNEYPKFYSIGQMGNSKKNVHALHDTANELECCIEVKNNQMPQQQMISTNYNLEDIGAEEDIFEFRYPEKVDFQNNANHIKMRDAWNDFVKWFSENDPCPRYNKFEDITTEQQFNQFAINKITQMPIEVWYLNEDKTAYVFTDKLIPNVTTYYTKTEHVNGYTDLPLPTDKIAAFRGKTFTTIKADETLQENYRSILEGFTTTEYDYLNYVDKDDKGNPLPCKNDIVQYEPGASNNGFYRDTREYRMAKLLNECEDHLIMESVVYHFLFIERHCMIDNVAKNTFWSTEDCQHWNLIKDYDNDTADGNDNNGHFTRTYGMEPLDKLNDTEHVFNAPQSVWFNFINGLHEVCEKVYQELEKKEVKHPDRNTPLHIWSAEDYLWFFNKWQKIIPERCWIEDYYRKYFRPYEVYGVALYNPMIEGGQKKYQRAHFERHQETYMASKYSGAAATNSYIWLRPTVKGADGALIPLQVYADCYVYTNFGDQISKTRLKRGEWGYFDCPVVNAENATTIIAPAHLITHLGQSWGAQLGHFKPATADFSMCTKLQELYYSQKDRVDDAGKLPTQMMFGKNSLLEKLYVCNIKEYGEQSHTLDLKGCINLKEFDGRGSSIESVYFADNAITESISLNVPTEVTLSNLTKLNTLNIDITSNITQLDLNNIDNIKSFSKDLTKDVLLNSDPLLYKLTNIKWNLAADDFNQNKTSITILDKLLTESEAMPCLGEDGQHNIPYAQALTGTITIGAGVYNSEDSINLYKKYILGAGKKFPNIDLIFEGEKAKLYNIVIYDGNNNVLWKKCIGQDQPLDLDFYSEGPGGEAFSINRIFKSDSAEKTYKFEGQWKVNNSAQIHVFTDDDDNSILPTWEKVTTDLYFYPQFTEEDKQYNVSIQFKNPITGEKSAVAMTTSSFKHGTTLQDILETITEVPYVLNENHDTFQGYDLIGYSSNEFSENILKMDYVLQDSITLWTVFKEVNDMRQIVHEEWFNIDSAGFCSPKFILGGKITIPSRARKLSDFRDCRSLQYMFLPDGNNLQEISAQCFATLDNKNNQHVSSTPLKYFDFINAKELTIVNADAFRGVFDLETYDLSQTKLATVGARGFNAAFSYKDINNKEKTLKLPGTLTELYSSAFANNFGKNSVYGERPSLQIGDKSSGVPISLFNSFTTTTPFKMNAGALYKEIVVYVKETIIADETLSTILNALATSCISPDNIDIIPTSS